MGPPREAGTAGEEQGGDAWCVLSLQCPSSCWRKWALTPRTLSCSRTTYTVMWRKEGYTTSSVAPCLCSGEPALPWFVCIPGTRLASLSHGGNHPLVSAHSEGMEVASAGSRGEEDTQGHPCGQQSTCAGRMECGMGKDRQEQAARTWGTESTSCLSLHPLVTAGGWYKGPRFSRLQEDRMIFTSSLAAFAHLWGMCPPWVSCSAWGNRTGWGGWLTSRMAPAQPRAHLRGSQTPNLSSKTNRHTKEQGTKHPCWI